MNILAKSDAPDQVLARRIITAAKLGERNPVRLQAAALRKSD
jgi:hypothetical protein